MVRGVLKQWGKLTDAFHALTGSINNSVSASKLGHGSSQLHLAVCTISFSAIFQKTIPSTTTNNCSTLNTQYSIFNTRYSILPYIELIPQYLNSTFFSVISQLPAENRIPLLFAATTRIRPGPIRGAPGAKAPLSLP